MNVCLFLKNLSSLPFARQRISSVLSWTAPYHDTSRFLFSVFGCVTFILLISTQVAGSLGDVQSGLRQHLERLDEIFAARADYLQTLGFMRLMVNNVIRELTALPDVTQANADLAAIADRTAFLEYYRWVEPAEISSCMCGCRGSWEGGGGGFIS